MKAAEQRLRDATPELAPLDAHALLTLVYRDGNNPIALRVLAAQAAIRYEKPALSSAQVDATVSLRLGLAEELKAAQGRLRAVSAVLVESMGSAAGPQIETLPASLAFAGAGT